MGRIQERLSPWKLYCKGGWICMGDACMTSVHSKKTALVLGKYHGPPVASQHRPLGGHVASYVVNGHFALFSDALATKMSVFKVKMVNGVGDTIKQTAPKKSKGKRLHSVRVSPG